MVDDYKLEKLGNAKGIFVSNQYRLDDFRESLKKRETFEPNLDYVKKRD